MGGRDSPGVWDGHAHAPVFKMANQGGPTVWRRELCPMFCGGLDGSGVWRKTDTCVCMAESLHCSPETITPLFANREYSKYKGLLRVSYLVDTCCRRRCLPLWSSRPLGDTARQKEALTAGYPAACCLAQAKQVRNNCALPELHSVCKEGVQTVHAIESLLGWALQLGVWRKKRQQTPSSDYKHRSHRLSWKVPVWD